MDAATRVLPAGRAKFRIFAVPSVPGHVSLCTEREKSGTGRWLLACRPDRQHRQGDASIWAILETKRPLEREGRVAVDDPLQTLRPRPSRSAMRRLRPPLGAMRAWTVTQEADIGLRRRWTERTNLQQKNPGITPGSNSAYTDGSPSLTVQPPIKAVVRSTRPLLRHSRCLRRRKACHSRPDNIEGVAARAHRGRRSQQPHRPGNRV